MFFETVVHPDELPDVEQAYTDVARGETDRFTVEFRTHPDNGYSKWIRAQAHVHGSDTLRGISIDITEQKRHERELERQNDRLEEVISVASHDLRNPLNVAQARVELARDECDNDHLERVTDAHDRMEMLIENLLTSVGEGKPLTRSGGETEAMDVVDLATLIETCWQHVGTAEATLVVDTTHRIRADRSRLQQLFENLFRNAVEHGGEAVTATVGDLDDEAGFYVADDGRGISASEREMPFERGYSTSEAGSAWDCTSSGRSPIATDGTSP